MSDFERYLAKTVLMRAISGFIGNDSGDFNLGPPTRFSSKNERPERIKHWIFEWSEPYYEVTLVESHQQLSEVWSFWIRGARTQRRDFGRRRLHLASV